MSFSRQILIFICIWGLLIYVFLTKLNGSTSSRELDDESRLNFAISSLEKSKNIDSELKNLLDEYVNDVASPDKKFEMLRRISAKFDNSVINQSPTGSSKKGVPTLEYEELRRRTTTNIGELFNYMTAELDKVEKAVKNELGGQQALKILKNFNDLAKEHKRLKIVQFSR